MTSPYAAWRDAPAGPASLPGTPQANPVDRLTRCVECDEWIDPLEQPHAAHEPSCDVDPNCVVDWSCRCDAYAHKRCCRACPPAVIPGQTSLLDAG